ncbi:MAG: serine/threonine protein kinase [Gemmataceae bacterium]|nr:serine/threonine protein kinase [Gemmataceae bacterium]
MVRFFIVAVLGTLIPLPTVDADEPKKAGSAKPIAVAPGDWPWWRGPNRDGIADAKQNPPIKWSEKENVLWQTPVPGRGHGSPIVVGDQVFLGTATAKDETQSVLCFDRKTGKQLWETIVHKGNFVKGGNAKSTLASATLACDGERVFANFLNDKAIHATALSRDGKILWQTKVTDYALHQGFASSPTVYQSLLFVVADSKAKGLIAGLDRATGTIVWQVERPKLPNYASPIIHKIDGRDQLFFIGCNLVVSLDPLTGKKYWETKGSTEECVSSTVTDGKLIITSGGFPKQHIAAIHADGSMKTAWEIKTQVYVPSMIYHRGHLFAVSDNGMALCWKFDTGKEVWKERLGGVFSASAVLVGDHFYATNEAGKTFIFKANFEKFELVAENQLAMETLATPTICGGRIYIRAAVTQNGQRQEMLYCVGNEK